MTAYAHPAPAGTILTSAPARTGDAGEGGTAADDPASRRPEGAVRGADLVDPEFEIDVDWSDAAWRDLLPDAEALARRLMAAVCEGPAELSLVLADDAAVRALNRDWRGRDRATNVLSFPAGDGALPAGVPRLLGDVVLARETVLAEAARDGKPVRDHATHLILHGLLHCLGHDHETGEEAATMEALETAVLGRLGIADPYAAPDPAAREADGQGAE